jgi:LppX_LprAFG lipoprotein
MRRTAIALSAAVLVAVSLTACSGGSTPPAGSPPAAKTVDALALVKKASDTGATLQSAHLETTTVLAGKTTTVVGDISYRPVELQETVTIAGTTVQELLVGRAFYIKTPLAASPGKPWVTISVAKMSKLIGIDLSSLLDNSRPDQTVQLLSASGDLKAVGTETVNGMSTQHLRGTVDLEQAMTTMTASSPAYKSIQAMVKSAGITDTHIELWVNEQNIPVKITETYTSKLGAGSTTMTLTKLNQPVHIVAPKPSQVTQFPG